MPNETCDICGNEIPSDSLNCPHCTFSAFFAGDQAEDSLNIPGFEILDVIGEGGFGLVYQAEQTEPVHRSVAMKVLKMEAMAKATRSRFAEEVQTLALLEHPGIARIYESGETDEGLPFYVMELVQGLTLMEWIQQKKPTLAQRLIVFQKICDAVEHAHIRGVIHRDLKPTNILINNEDSLPKVIDFGVARVFEGPVSVGREVTLDVQLMGTPEFMSPEQLAGEANIDIRSDVYSLGCILYSMLSTKSLFRETLQKAHSWKDKLDAIDEFAPPSLSSFTPDGIYGRTERNRLKELDWLAWKAIAKKRDDRYQTVSELNLDLTRFLSNQPISAGPPSWIYRTRKFLSRNLAAVITLSMVMVTLLGTTITTYILALKAVAPKEKTVQELNQEFNKNRQLSRYINNLHEVASIESLDHARTLMEFELNDQAGERLDRAVTFYSKNQDVGMAAAAFNAWHRKQYDLQPADPNILFTVEDHILSSDGKTRFDLDGVQFHFTGFWDPSEHPASEWIDELITQIKLWQDSNDERISEIISSRHNGSTLFLTKSGDLYFITPSTPAQNIDQHVSAAGFTINSSATGIAYLKQHKQISIFDLETGEKCTVIDAPADIATIYLSDNNKHLTAVTPDQTLYVYECLEATLSPKVIRHTAANDGKSTGDLLFSFSRFGSVIATAHTNDSKIKFWNSMTGEPHGPPIDIEGQIEQLKFSRSSFYLYTAQKRTQLNEPVSFLNIWSMQYRHKIAESPDFKGIITDLELSKKDSAAGIRTSENKTAVWPFLQISK